MSSRYSGTIGDAGVKEKQRDRMTTCAWPYVPAYPKDNVFCTGFKMAGAVVSNFAEQQHILHRASESPVTDLQIRGPFRAQHAVFLLHFAERQQNNHTPLTKRIVKPFHSVLPRSSHKPTHDQKLVAKIRATERRFYDRKSGALKPSALA